MRPREPSTATRHQGKQTWLSPATRIFFFSSSKKRGRERELAWPSTPRDRLGAAQCRSRRPCNPDETCTVGEIFPPERGPTAKLECARPFFLFVLAGFVGWAMTCLAHGELCRGGGKLGGWRMRGGGYGGYSCAVAVGITAGLRCLDSSFAGAGMCPLGSLLCM
ncbi:hypothetical protein BS50DRAFT_309612 [Corynespora cassiicola Philippines]|uniref:Uncharacterized protein n=1 Tax=Corynespora cassiicola Philippines TaxID=1448308 RepID=A0A2T2NXX3_CORCC|nr:hypothetical protein BS50DRAFT_309612 [Corynespora cassiicola Philippines]